MQSRVLCTYRYSAIVRTAVGCTPGDLTGGKDTASQASQSHGLILEYSGFHDDFALHSSRRAENPSSPRLSARPGLVQGSLLRDSHVLLSQIYGGLLCVQERRPQDYHDPAHGKAYTAGTYVLVHTT